MTTLRKVAYQCPVCTHEFETQKVVATNSYGGQAHGFSRARGRWHQPLPHQGAHVLEVRLHRPGRGIQDERPDLWPTVIEQLMEEMPKYRGRTLTGSEKWEAAAEAAKIMGEEDKVLAG
jgi:hypothetical protein